VGAVFQDGGFDVAEKFVLQHFKDEFSGLSNIPILENPKGELQELLQAKSQDAPLYHVVSTTGPDHDRVFECTVHHAGRELARGRGKSKKEAESQAAFEALTKLRSEQAN
jgi:ribonuclease-3